VTGLPFEDSRRLTGANWFFASTAAVLDVTGTALDAGLIAAWRARVGRAMASLAWRSPPAVARMHAGGVQLAIAAPHDQLFLATEINEWALCAALFAADPIRWVGLEAALRAEAQENAGHDAPAADAPPVLEEAAALERFRRLAALEVQPALGRLLAAAAARFLPVVLDDEALTLGAGASGRSFPRDALPPDALVPWDDLGDIPTAIVTGSNGKTTTVRLLAACARGAGWHAGYSCTDGVYVDDERVAGGDYAGPAGARMVLRDRRVQAAILETARGGMLRRGLAVSQAAVAIVTNVSADHFGEYGVDDLTDLAATKLTVAAAVVRRGLLVLNADDDELRAQAEELPRRYGKRPLLGWFSAQPDSAALAGYGARGDLTCGPGNGRLHLKHGRVTHDLGAVADMPLTIGGLAGYNVANLAGVALAALALGITPALIGEVFAHFGARYTDNPGRMMRFERDGVTILIDYAHNPGGLRGFLEVARRLCRHGGRLATILGQAGNRLDAEIDELVQVAAQFHPDLVVIKENETQLRGRAPGEMPQLIRSKLLQLGVPESSLPMTGTEVEAARYALHWARAGDIVALPLHIASARQAILADLQASEPGASPGVVSR
jgi:cyanophycin synthetase